MLFFLQKAMGAGAKCLLARLETIVTGKESEVNRIHAPSVCLYVRLSRESRGGRKKNTIDSNGLLSVVANICWDFNRSRKGNILKAALTKTHPRHKNVLAPTADCQSRKLQNCISELYSIRRELNVCETAGKPYGFNISANLKTSGFLAGPFIMFILTGTLPYNNNNNNNNNNNTFLNYQQIMDLDDGTVWEHNNSANNETFPSRYNRISVTQHWPP
jgi:hypothetical protein